MRLEQKSTIKKALIMKNETVSDLRHPSFFRALRMMALPAALAAASSDALAFGEDLCAIDGKIRNCLTAEACDPSRSDTRKCRVNVMFEAGAASVAGGMNMARSTIHVDATHLIAQAVGFAPQAAYWIAAYDQVVDVEQYQPLDMTGTLVSDAGKYTTARLNGWGRNSYNIGGFAYHYVAPFQPAGETLKIDCGSERKTGTVCGTHPDLSDSYHEGLLVHLREWALKKRAPCADGLTELIPEISPPNYFLGGTCYREDPKLVSDPAQVARWIVADMPLFTGMPDVTLPIYSYSGRQIASYKAPMSDIRYADELEALVTEAGQPAETAELARMGIYLHVLQDRISHAECEDASTLSGPDDKGQFYFKYDTKTCTQDKHAYGHYLEIGWENLPERTVSALDYTYNELATFAKAFPQWTTGKPAAPAKEQLIADITAALKVEDGCQRMSAMIRIADKYGFEQMPGNTMQGLDALCR
jgi:hypothetical protein